jgi:hypothetical protein
VNRFDRAREVARREALAAAWADSARTLREELDAEAREEYAANDNGVTWMWRDFGRVTLPLSEETIVVTDIDLLRKWVKEHHPEQIRVVEEVWPAFQTHLLKNGVITGEGVQDPETGSVVPGLAVRPGGVPKALTITVDKDAKRLFANYAAQEVERALAAEYGTPTAGPADDSVVSE